MSGKGRYARGVFATRDYKRKDEIEGLVYGGRVLHNKDEIVDSTYVMGTLTFFRFATAYMFYQVSRSRAWSTASSPTHAVPR